MKVAAVMMFGLLVLASPIILQSVPRNYYVSSTQLLFYGTTQLNVLNQNTVLLTLNATDVEPTAISAIAQAVIENTVNNQTVAVENSSVVMFEPSAPTIVNMTVTGLDLCTNYSIAVGFQTLSGAILTPVHTFYEFPCEVYSTALTLDSAINPWQSCGACVNATLTNDLNVSLTAVVFAIYHIPSGETISVSTSTVVFGADQNGSAFFSGIGVSLGDYNVTLFAWDSGGVPVSNSSIVAVS